MTDKVMQQALEALASYSVGERLNASQVNDLIAQLEAALEQPEQEPTCPKCKAGVLYECVACSSNNYPSKAQRPWVGLTDKELLLACQLAEQGNYLLAFQRIQDKLKERNT
jgi:hypothetical protein